MHLLLSPMQQTDRLISPSVNWGSLTPLLVLLGAGLVLLVGAALSARGWAKGLYATLTAAAAVAAGVLQFVLWNSTVHNGPKPLVGEAIVVDGPSLFIGISICAALLLAALVTDNYLRREDIDSPEVYGLYLMAALGGLVMAASNDLIVLFLGLEVLSIALYVLAASHRKRIESQEAGLKYFILGGFSSAFFLYGIALVYGATGTTRLRGPESIKTVLALTVETDKHRALLVVGVALLLVGLAFKVAAVPFHSWTPDVYQGAPTPVTGFMASAAKAAAFGALLRSVVLSMPELRDDWRPAIWVLAILTLVIGSTLAVVQTNVKRMLAYSSISHIGFVMLGLFAMTTESLQGSVLQMLNHGVSTGALFLLVGFLHERTRTRIISDLGGIAKVMPIFAGVFTLVMFSSAGLPFTNGFVGEFLILTGTFKNATDGLQPFAIIGASGVVLSAVYLLWMYQRAMQGPVNPAFSSPDDRPSNVAGGRTGLVLADLTVREMMVLLPLAALIIWIGVYPRPFLDRTAASVEAISARMALPQTGVLASGTGARVP